MRAILSALMLSLTLSMVACNDPSEPAPPPSERVEKAGSSMAASGCLSGLMSALSVAVRDLHVRSNCSRSSETGKFNWAYIYKEELNEGNSYDLIDDCIDRFATHLNDHIPYLQISLSERCRKRVKMFNGDRLVWAFDYGNQR